MLWNFKTLRRSLKNRLLFWVWLVTSVATFIFTFTQLFFEFNAEKKLAYHQIDLIYQNNLPSLSESLWDYNTLYTSIQCDNLKKIPYVGQVIITADNKVLCNYTSPEIQNNFSSLSKTTIPVFHKDEKIGELTIGLDIGSIQYTYFIRTIKTLLIQGLKTFIVCILLLKIFEILIMKHLESIVGFLKNFDLNNTTDLQLERSSDLNDDLTIVQNSINLLKKNLQETHRQLIHINQNLEKEVIERTIQRDEERAKSIEAARLASLGQMASSIAHEINNPMAIIAMSTKNLKKKYLQDQLSKEYMLEHFEVVNSTIVRVTKIIKGLQTLSRNSTDIEKENFKIKDMVSEVLSVCSERFKHNEIDIRENTSEFTEVNCNRVQLSQVLLNLLGNSLDSIKNLPDRWIEIRDYSDDNYNYISIKDSGAPIPMDLQSKIFNPFFTTKDIGEGTGLGLSISKKILEKHGGDLFIDNTVSNVCFILKIPR